MLYTVELATDEEIKKMVMKCKIAQCSCDPIITKFVKEGIDALVPVMMKIVNLLLSGGFMLNSFKNALISFHF